MDGGDGSDEIASISSLPGGYHAVALKFISGSHNGERNVSAAVKVISGKGDQGDPAMVRFWNKTTKIYEKPVRAFETALTALEDIVHDLGCSKERAIEARAAEREHAHAPRS